MIGIGLTGPLIGTSNRGQFSPSDVAGLLASLSADVGVTVTTGVSAWADQSGVGNNLSQATGANQPALVASWRNGKAAIQGAASKQLSRATLVGGDRSMPVTYYIVDESPASVVSQQMIVDGMLNVGRHATYYTAGNLPSLFGSVVLSAAGAPAVSTPCIRRSVFNGATSSIRIEPHGGTVITASGDAGNYAIRGLSVLSAFDGTQNYLGKLARVLMYGGLVSAENDGQILSYLRNYYNIRATGL